MRTFLLLINLLVCFVANSQTTLERGDIMVLGVNVRNYDNICGTYSGSGPQNYYDNIHLVSFKDIVNGTSIQITDNRYISGNNFSNTEGFISLQRTGGTIPAGSSIKFDIPASYSAGTVINGWTITYRDKSLALSGSGEQFIIFQNATWNTSGSVSGTNLKYLLAYNTKRDWNSAANTNNSLLPSTSTNDLRCFHISNPTTTPLNRNFGYYSGSTTENISSGEWNVRILNSANWTNASSCSDFGVNVYAGTLPIRTTVPSQEICINESLTDLEVVNESNVVTYQWYRNETASTTGTPVPVGTNSHVYTPSNTLVGTYYYYCVMTINLPLNGTPYSSCPFTSGFFEVIVNPNPITSPVVPL